MKDLANGDYQRYQTPILTDILDPAMDKFGKKLVVDAMADQADHLSKATGCDVSFHNMLDSNCAQFSKHGHSWFRVSSPRIYPKQSKIRVVPIGEIPIRLCFRLDGDIRIQGSSEAIDYYRNSPPCIDRDIRLQIEQAPYRYQKDSADPVQMYERVVTEEGIKVGPVSKEWLDAPIELVIGYGFGGMQAFGYERTLESRPTP